MTGVSTKSNEVKFISVNNKPPFYGWFKMGCDAYCNLGQMKKAVVVRLSISKQKYFIANSSYFPFTNEIYDARYDTLEEAVKVANNVIVKWLGETYENLGL